MPFALYQAVGWAQIKQRKQGPSATRVLVSVAASRLVRWVRQLRYAHRDGRASPNHEIEILQAKPIRIMRSGCLEEESKESAYRYRQEHARTI